MLSFKVGLAIAACDRTLLICIYLGLATSLDTLCAQAYGAGQKQLVGLHMQRMVFFLLVISIPISVVWYDAPYFHFIPEIYQMLTKPWFRYFGENILNLIVPDKQLAALAGTYLRVLIFGL